MLQPITSGRKVKLGDYQINPDSGGQMSGRKSLIPFALQIEAATAEVVANG